MGSLMAGWASPVVDSERAKLERNKSLTKEEIEAFWKMHKRGEEKDGAPSPTASSFLEEAKADSMTLKKTALWEDLEKSSAPELEEAKTTGDWWTRSNWAFLNEPPHDEVESAHKYVAQFHVAEIATKRA